MNWIVQRFAAAVITGVGIKLGGDVYETLKAKLKERQGESKDDDSVSDAVVAAADAAQRPAAEADLPEDAAIVATVEEVLR
ncbi:MAG: hypothetical protein CSB49_03865 [Proteobacteria bacterium]|nr:MAG: hypothetical protein CSB49_03865 [Pseudomonadota bacterium]